MNYLVKRHDLLQDTKIQIKDIKGYIYYSQQIDDLPSGTYILSLTSGKIVVTKRIDI